MSKTLKPLILISGATATGKTDLAVELALLLGERGKKCEVINADSLLFYKELSIGTAKPTQEEKKGVPHHLFDIASVTTPINASEYCELALALIKRLHQEDVIPLLVGGSAFYIRALLKGMYETEEAKQEEMEQVEQMLEKLEKEHGWSGVRAKLNEVDPKSFESIHENDRYRSLRALEYFLLHQKPISEEKIKMEESGPYDFSRLQNKEWSLHHIYLQIPKEKHWPLMEKRAKKMLSRGLIEEVKGLLASGLSPQLKPLQSIGYKEPIEALSEQQELSKAQKDELAERIYINTRRLAKSQKTFFNKITPKNSYNPLEDHDKIRENLIDFINKFS